MIAQFINIVNGSQKFKVRYQKRNLEILRLEIAVATAVNLFALSADLNTENPRATKLKCA